MHKATRPLLQRQNASVYRAVSPSRTSAPRPFSEASTLCPVRYKFLYPSHEDVKSQAPDISFVPVTVEDAHLEVHIGPVMTETPAVSSAERFKALRSLQQPLHPKLWNKVSREAKGFFGRDPAWYARWKVSVRERVRNFGALLHYQEMAQQGIHAGNVGEFRAKGQAIIDDLYLLCGYVGDSSKSMRPQLMGAIRAMEASLKLATENLPN